MRAARRADALDAGDQDARLADAYLGDGALQTMAPPDDWVPVRVERERLWEDERTLFPNLSGKSGERDEDEREQAKLTI